MNSRAERSRVIDVWRGFAFALMVVYHFCFDLVYFGLADFDMYDGAGWIIFRATILGQFLLLVGAGIGFSRTRPRLFRVGQIALCAAAISLISWPLFGLRMIFFGVLHFIVVALLLAALLLRLGNWNLPLGVSLIAIGVTVEAPLFDRPALQWLGMMTYKPPTEDYVPLLPWLGVVQIGLVLGRSLSEAPERARRLDRRLTGIAMRLLGWAGKHSLLLYLLHQPLLMGSLYLALLAR